MLGRFIWSRFKGRRSLCRYRRPTSLPRPLLYEPPDSGGWRAAPTGAPGVLVLILRTHVWPSLVGYRQGITRTLSPLALQKEVAAGSGVESSH